MTIGAVGDPPPELARAAPPAWRAPRRRRRLALSGAIVGVVVLRLVVVEPVRVESASMAPTLRSDDHLLTQTLLVGQRRVHRGELVTFDHPTSRALTLKRVVAVGGDVVEIRDGRLFVNAVGQAEPYVDAESLDGVHFGPVQVPPRTVFVLGDNRANSDDSRTFGALPVSHLVGTVVVRLWPLSRAGTVS